MAELVTSSGQTAIRRRSRRSREASTWRRAELMMLPRHANVRRAGTPWRESGLFENYIEKFYLFNKANFVDPSNVVWPMNMAGEGEGG